MTRPYRNKEGHLLSTASTVTAILVSLGDDVDLDRLPSQKGDDRTKEAQALLDHVYSDAYKEGDPLYDQVVEAYYHLASIHCLVAAGIVYEQYIEKDEDGVSEAESK